jgi:hypothetical protein
MKVIAILTIVAAMTPARSAGHTVDVDGPV